MKINPAGLNKRQAHELMMSAIAPRPVVMVSTVGENGVFNLAPFSNVMTLSLDPVLIGLVIGRRRDGQKKDTIKNIEFSREFVLNIVDDKLGKPMNKASFEYPPDVSEFKETGLTALKSEFVKAPRVAESPVTIECKLSQILEFGKLPANSHMVVGEVIIVHIKDDLWSGEFIEPAKLHAIGRVGGQDSYCRTSDIFELLRPNR
jgi:flavin reductase (DIM6/NTAB) family NADH-FMN oxidoreductase RutF